MSKLRQITNLVRLTYSPSRYQKISKEIDDMIQTRAWLAHCVITVIRGLFMCLDAAPWQRALSKRAQVEHDETFVDSIEDFVLIGTIALAALGFIADLLCYKWRKVSLVLLYLELAFALLISLAPYQSGVVGGQIIVLWTLLATSVLYIVPLCSLVCMAVIDMLIIFGLAPQVWDLEADTEYQLQGFILILLVVMAQMGVSLLFTDSAQSRLDAKSLRQGDFVLLDNMQEGLFVLDSTLTKIKLGTKTAMRIMDRVRHEGTGSEPHADIDSELLSLPHFLPIWVTMDKLTGRKDDSPNLLTSADPHGDYLSLHDIINRRSREAGVYMIRPGGPLPSCQPVNVKNQFCSIHVKKIDYMGEECTAVYFCCMTHHVDAMRFQSEIIEEKNRSETYQSYTATISHELRTPISTCIMFLEQLKMVSTDPVQLNFIRLVINQLNFLLSLVNDLIDMKMLENGVFEPRIVKFDLKQILDFIMEMFKDQCQLVGNTVNYKVLEPGSIDQAYDYHYDEMALETAQMPGTLYGDSFRLKQILINLVKNATKFTKNGSICVYAAFNPSQDTLKVHVQDTGKGILESEKERLFNMFGKLKRTAKQNSEGIGMGLMICKQLVESNGGSIDVRSRGADQGCSFIFTMRMSDRKKEWKPVHIQNEVIENHEAEVEELARGQIDKTMKQAQRKVDQDTAREQKGRAANLDFDESSSAADLSDRKLVPDDQNDALNGLNKSEQDFLRLIEKVSQGSSKGSLTKSQDAPNFNQANGNARQANFTFRKPETDSQSKPSSLSQSNSLTLFDRKGLKQKNQEDSRGDMSDVKLSNDAKPSEQIDQAVDSQVTRDHQQLAAKRKTTSKTQECSRERQMSYFGRQNIQSISKTPSSPNSAEVTNSNAPILVTDDDHFNIIALKGLLQQFNLSADIATNGIEAVNFVERRIKCEKTPMYRLILMDYSMPDMDGIVCVKNIRQRLDEHPDIEAPRITCISAYWDQASKGTAMVSGMDEFMTKPIFKLQLQDQLIKANLIQ